ncbi:MAG: AAA family ATPase [Saprospiraceae bacterium]
MSRIKIKNFGPIKEGCLENDGWLDLRKVTLFIGNQGSGKSTIAKLISIFKWMEKVLVRGDFTIDLFTQSAKFKEVYCAYHKIQNYFKEDTALHYQGNAYQIDFLNGQLRIIANDTSSYELPQIMYVPAERNFISTIRNPELLKLSSDALTEFLVEFDNAKRQIHSNGMNLPINNAIVVYDDLKDELNIKGEDYKISLIESSSGFQSIVPLYIVSNILTYSLEHLLIKGNTSYIKKLATKPMSSEELKRFKKGVSTIWANDDLTDDQRRVALSALSSKFNKSAFINIVEEPEQNLFPKSQQQLLNSLLKLNNVSKGNELIMTTHSPYIINYLTIAIQGMALQQKINATKHTNGALSKLHEVVPENATISAKDVVIYQLNEKNGRIEKLDNYEGVPSDDNYLNQSLAVGNELFDTLLEIEQGL